MRPDSPQWEAMWDALARATGDHADECPENGEVWQYMGTYDGAHQFRHRNRPRTARPINGFGPARDRVYLHLDEKTLQVVLVTARIYDDRQAYSAAVRTAHMHGPVHPVKPTGRSSSTDHDYGGAFDGFTVTSDADPGL